MEVSSVTTDSKFEMDILVGLLAILTSVNSDFFLNWLFIVLLTIKYPYIKIH